MILCASEGQKRSPVPFLPASLGETEETIHSAERFQSYNFTRSDSMVFVVVVWVSRIEKVGENGHAPNLEGV